jgi:hypothetical protein
MLLLSCVALIGCDIDSDVVAVRPVRRSAPQGSSTQIGKTKFLSLYLVIYPVVEANRPLETQHHSLLSNLLVIARRDISCLKLANSRAGAHGYDRTGTTEIDMRDYFNGTVVKRQALTIKAHRIAYVRRNQLTYVDDCQPEFLSRIEAIRANLKNCPLTIPQGCSRQFIGLSSFICIPEDGEQSEQAHPERKVFKMVLYGSLALVLTGAGVYQFKFKLADETTMQGILLRIGGGIGLIVIGQAFLLCFLILVDR